jgi:hypothetical protein
MRFDRQAVREFEHAGWQQAAAGYGASFARATAEYVEALLDAARVRAGTRLLDLCCGPGLAAAAAARRDAVPAGADFSMHDHDRRRVDYACTTRLAADRVMTLDPLPGQRQLRGLVADIVPPREKLNSPETARW